MAGISADTSDRLCGRIAARISNAYVSLDHGTLDLVRINLPVLSVFLLRFHPDCKLPKMPDVQTCSGAQRAVACLGVSTKE